MKLVKTTVLVASAFALAVGSAWAADKDKEKSTVGNATRSDDSGFAKLDKNKDGYISREEAKANPELYKKFKQADKNGDGKLSRFEYLEAMTKQDATTAKNKVERVIDPDEKKESGAGSTTSK